MVETNKTKITAHLSRQDLVCANKINLLTKSGVIMTKDFNRFYLSKRMFLGATMLLTSVGLASANPGIEIPVSDALVASPQQAKKKVTGTVEDALGPIAGANVVEKGTTNGTITDMDGKFNLEVSPNAVLVITFIGYVEQQIPVGNLSLIHI